MPHYQKVPVILLIDLPIPPVPLSSPYPDSKISLAFRCLLLSRQSGLSAPDANNDEFSRLQTQRNIHIDTRPSGRSVVIKCSSIVPHTVA